MAKTQVMRNKYGEAGDILKKAMRLFKKTKDPRGIIYSWLSLAELSALRGRHEAAKKTAALAFKEASLLGFAVEKCHAKSLLSCLSGKGQGAPTLSDKCYNRLRLKHNLKSIPFNIP